MWRKYFNNYVTNMGGKSDINGDKMSTFYFRQLKQMGKQWKQCQTLFLGAPKSLQMVTAAMKLKDAYSLEGKL